MEQDNPPVHELPGRGRADRRPRSILVGLVVVLAAGAAGSMGAAVRFHEQAARLSDRDVRVFAHQFSVGSAPAPSSSAVVVGSGSESPRLSSHSYDLATAGQLRATVYLTTASTEGGGSSNGQLVVSGLVRGGQPGVKYQFTGGDCDVSSQLDIVWAESVADANGTAFMTGQSRTLPKDDDYTLAVGASPGPTSGRPGPGIEGVFVLGQAWRYAGEPCN